MGEGDIAQIIMQTAIASGIDPYLALAVAQQESGLNPGAIGDGGYSFGLYQENTAGGAGSTYLNNGGSYEDFFDPVSSTQRFADRVKYAMSQLGPDATPGEIAYAAQRPANRDAYIGAIDGLYQQSATSGGGGPKLMADVIGGGDNVSYDPNNPYDPGLFGDTGTGDGTTPSDAGAGTDTGADQPWYVNLWNFLSHLGQGSSGAPPADAPVPGSESKGAPVHYQSLGNGRILFTYSDGTTEVKDFGTSGTSGGTSLSDQAAKAGFYKFDYNEGYTPDVDAYVKYMAAKNAKAISGGGGSAGSGIVNLGSGRYLVKNPDGTYTEKTFGGAGGAGSATPPSLDPTRSSIVNYLRALLGQNDLPYSAVTPARTTGADASSAAPAVPTTTTPAPAPVAPPPVPGTTPSAGVTPPPSFSTPGTVNPSVPTLVTDPNIPQNATVVAPYGKQVSLAPGITPADFLAKLGQ